MIVYVSDDTGATYQVRFEGTKTLRELAVQRGDPHSARHHPPLDLSGAKARQMIAKARLQVATKGSNL
jgi:hypothetical protein